MFICPFGPGWVLPTTYMRNACINELACRLGLLSWAAAPALSTKTFFMCCVQLPWLQVARHRSGRSAGFAIVAFSKIDQAMAALGNMDNGVFLGRRLSVRIFQPDRANEQSQAQCKNPGFMDSLPLMLPEQILALAGLLDPNMLATDYAPQHAATDPLPQDPPGWSHLVSSWLNDYVSGAAGASPCMGCHALAGL